MPGFRSLVVRVAVSSPFAPHPFVFSPKGNTVYALRRMTPVRNTLASRSKTALETAVLLVENCAYPLRYAPVEVVGGHLAHALPSQIGI